MAQRNYFPVDKQLVKLTTVGEKRAFQVINGFNRGLYPANMIAYANQPAELFLDVRSGSEVVGMGVGFQDPLQR